MGFLGVACSDFADIAGPRDDVCLHQQLRVEVKCNAKEQFGHPNVERRGLLSAGRHREKEFNKVETWP